MLRLYGPAKTSDLYYLQLHPTHLRIYMPNCYKKYKSMHQKISLDPGEYKNAKRISNLGVRVWGTSNAFGPDPEFLTNYELLGVKAKK